MFYDMKAKIYLFITIPQYNTTLLTLFLILHITSLNWFTCFSVSFDFHFSFILSFLLIPLSSVHGNHCFISYFCGL